MIKEVKKNGIPKIIHYCWFGGKKLPKSAKKCITSWKKYMPDYEIKEWNESNFDVNMITYTEQAYQKGKYAFVSDYARFYILYHEGGVYFDTDVELIAPIDDIIENGKFMGCEIDGGKGQTIHVAPGLGLASEPRMEIYKRVLEVYGQLFFLNADGTLNTKTVVSYITEILSEYGLKNIQGIQKVQDITIYPKEYFNPLENNTGRLSITPNTRSIHWYSMTWISGHERVRSYITRMFHRIFGDECFEWLKRLMR